MVHCSKKFQQSTIQCSFIQMLIMKNDKVQIKFYEKNIISKLEGPIFTVYTSFTEAVILIGEMESYLKFLFENGVETYYVMLTRYSQLYEAEIFELNKL